jgi:REP-associated tyrosine transposase
MSRNYYSEINLHLTWHTKLSRPMLTPDVQTFVHRYLKQRIVGTPGLFIHEIGGIETHVHLAITIAPTILISELVGQLKGATSHETNQHFAGKILEWQPGYGVVSYGTKDLEWVRRYIRNQREHHARGSIEDRLERITTDDDGTPMAEAGLREGS